MRQAIANGGIESLVEETGQKTRQSLDSYGLDVDSYSDAEVKNYNARNIARIRSDLRGNGLLKAGITFSGNATDKAKVSYLSALVEQNWVLIRQNELILRRLEKLGEK